MITYPSITHKPYSGRYFVFDKHDGSNIRAEWSESKGFWKFGTRRLLLGLGNPLFGAVDLIKEQTDKLAPLFIKHKYKSVTCFFEYLGQGSFAGSHLYKDMRVELIDVHVKNRGLLPPLSFVKMFEPESYLGNHKYEDIVEQVRSGEFPGMTFEGVVCKSHKKNKRLAYKIKNLEWIQKVKELHGHNWKKYY